MIQLDDRVALVTGGGRGIGRGIVLALARAGADVVIGDVDQEGAEATAKEVEALGRRSRVVRLDVIDEDITRAAVAEVLEAFGRVDILVNNAGVVQGVLAAETGRDDFERCFAVNTRGIWTVTAALMPHLKERREGRVVNIASIAGRQGGAPLPAYCASKAGAISLTQSLAAELGPYGVNVNAVCPGLLWTPMWEKLEGMFRQSDDASVVSERAAFDAHLAANCPLGREQTAEDIGHAVAFLVSDLAKNITGQALNVDGGLEMN